MAEPFKTSRELLEFLEGNGLLHRIVRRNVPGYSDDGIITSWPYRACSGEMPMDLKTEECLGCAAKKLLEAEKNLEV